jgi:hypothetical protein
VKEEYIYNCYQLLCRKLPQKLGLKNIYYLL